MYSESGDIFLWGEYVNAVHRKTLFIYLLEWNHWLPYNPIERQVISKYKYVVIAYNKHATICSFS